MTAVESDLTHELRKARSELGEARAALMLRACTIEERAMAEAAGDITKAAEIASELGHSIFFFRAFQEASRQNRVLRTELHNLKVLVRDLLQAKDRAPSSHWHEIVGERFAALDQAVRRG